MIEAPSVFWYFCEGIFFCLIAASYVLSFSSLRLTRVAMQPVRISLRTVVERRRGLARTYAECTQRRRRKSLPLFHVSTSNRTFASFSRCN